MVRRNSSTSASHSSCQLCQFRPSSGTVHFVHHAGGRQKAIPAALYCALGAGGAHYLSQRLQLGHAFRKSLVRMDLLDDEAICEELSRPPEPFRPVPAAELGWKKYLPVRQMTAEEYEAYQQKKAKGKEHSLARMADQEHPREPS